jgi:hypothetical protein
VQSGRDHPSDIFDYFQPLEAIEQRGLMPALHANCLDKRAAVNRAAAALTVADIAVKPAAMLHATRERAASAA